MADQLTSQLMGVLLNKPLPVPPLPGPMEGVVVSTGAGGVRVILPGFHNDWAWGPCFYSRPSSGSGYPPIGTRCLMVLSSVADNSNPWIVAFSGWPA